MNPLIQLKQTNSVFVFTLLLVSFGFLSAAQAVVPAPDGGYPGANTAEGQNALLSRTTGTNNTAVGWSSLRSVTTGGYNTSVGAGALSSNIATGNTATGSGALFKNTTGNNNSATGFTALYNNTTGSWNTANGYGALSSNINTIYNTAAGTFALHMNRGTGNTATGFSTLRSNSIGNNNTAEGREALGFNTTGSNNTALGVKAGSNLTTGNNNIDIGYNVTGVAGESNTIRIGNANITDTIISGIYNQTLFVGLPVFIMPNGILGTSSSSKRFKEEIKPMEKASEAVYSLKPITFRYQKDPANTPQFGLVAEDVEKVNPDLVVRDKEGKPYSVRYDQVNAMLLNEFLKEHRAVLEQQKQIESLRAELKEQRILIQKVSAELEVSKPAGKTVLNNN